MEPKNAFEEKILSGYKKPEPAPDFVNQLQVQLRQKEAKMESQKSKIGFRWAYVFAPLMALLILFRRRTLSDRPVQTWFNFVPGLGVVESQLASGCVGTGLPNSDGVTVGIKSGVITPDQANFEVELINVPLEQCGLTADEPVAMKCLICSCRMAAKYPT